MLIKKWKLILFVLVISAGVFLLAKQKIDQSRRPAGRTVPVVYGDIQKFITATATVQPQNRLEMKSPIGGRVEKILVVEGQSVKTGDILAYMSSTERAALLDAARPEGEQSVKYWEDVYKPTPIISPIDGEVIVKSTQPGQTVTTADDVLVLSDRLIVEAQIDETDVGKVKEGQKAVITLDAYPEIEEPATVGHIYYESQIVNNVTIYKVDILPDEVPAVFRSGMSANIRIIEQNKEHILLAPLEAVKKGKNKSGSFVLVSQGKNKKPERRDVQIGIADENNVEIVSGVQEGDVLVIPAVKTTAGPAKPKTGSNPFMPTGGGQRRT